VKNGPDGGAYYPIDGHDWNRPGETTFLLNGLSSCPPILISVNLRETVAGAVNTILSPKLFFQTGENLIYLRLILRWDADLLKPRAGATQDFNARLCYPENIGQVRNQLLVGLPISGLPFDLNEDVIV
jgi:hypothetical protein